MPGLMWPHLRHPRELDAMVEAQTRRWALKQRGGSEAVAGTLPVVPISRDLGDQGLALGRSVAQRFGFGRHK
jgi:hypothetical protein